MTTSQSTYPTVAVIILNWNGEKLLREFLPAVVANTNSQLAKVIVADNGSTDGSVKYITDRFPEIELIQFDQNYGFAEGYNKAIKQCSQYKYTVLLNSDVETAPHWIEPLVAKMEANPEIGALQPKILSYKNRDRYEYAGASGGFIDKHGYPFCRGRIFDTTEDDNGQYDDCIEIFWASGAALCVRTEVYLNAGGLDKYFFAHMEEIDLCWRIHLLGYKIEVVPQSVIYHLGGGSLPASNPRKTYLNFRNNLLLLHKNLPESDRARALFVRRLYDTVAFFGFLAKGEWGNAKAVIKAHNDFRSMRKQYYSDYKPGVAKNLLRTFPHTNRNIIVDYYLKGEKRFS